MSYAYTYDSQGTHPALLKGQVKECFFKVKNTGTSTWNKSFVRLGTVQPNDRACRWADPNDSRWIGNNRIEMEETTVAPGQYGTFRFNITPDNLLYDAYASTAFPDFGEYTEHFKPVADGIAWMTGNPLFLTWRYIDIEFPYTGGNAYKGQLHAHTTESDGDFTPAQQAQAYKDLGYDFIAITDHNKITSDPQVSGITFLDGVEECYSASRAHFLAWDTPYHAPDLSTTSLTLERHHPNALLGLAHPDAGAIGITQTELDGLKDFRLFEVFNGMIGQNPPSTAKTSQGKYLSVLNRNRKAWCFASDDAHYLNDRNKGWVVVYASENTKPALMDSLRKGNFYASSGSDITLSLDGTKLTATSTNSGTFKFIGSSYSSPLKTATGTTADYDIQGNENHVWVKHEKSGSDGVANCAWAQPIFIRKQR